MDEIIDYHQGMNDWGGYLRPFLAIVNNYLVIFTAGDQRVTGG